MSNYNYVNRVQIGDGSNSGVITAYPQIQKGDLIILNEAGIPVTTNADAALLKKYEKITIVAGTGPGRGIMSSPIQGNTVSAYEGKDFRAPAEQVAYLGYNAVDAGTGLVVELGTEYRLRISIQEDQPAIGQRQTLGDFHYAGGTSGTVDAAVIKAIDAIACSYAQKEYGVNYMGDKVKLERVSNGTQTTAPTASVVTGSPVVVSTSHGVSVGAYVRFTGPTDEFPIYKVKAVIDTNTLELDVPYLSATNSTEPMSVMSAQSEFGFKLTGIKQDALLSRAANEPYDQYEWILFEGYFGEASDRDFDAKATYTLDTTVDPGNGYWKQIAQREEDAKGYLGDTSKRRFHDSRINSNVQVDVEYDTIVITHDEENRGDFQGTYKAPLKTEIYIPNGANQGLDSGDNFVDILNGFLSESVGFPAVVFS
jgi:hypothetical protein